MFSINVHQEQIAHNLDEAKQHLEAASRRLQESSRELEVASIAYKPMRKGFSKVVSLALQPVACVAELPGAWIASVAMHLSGVSLWLTTVILACLGVWIGLWLGRTTVASRNSHPESVEAKEHLAAMILAVSYLVTTLALRLSFSASILGLQGIGSMVMLMLVSAAGLALAYECAANTESDEAAHLRKTIRQLRRTSVRDKSQYDAALDEVQRATAASDRFRQSYSAGHKNGVPGATIAVALAICILSLPAAAHAQSTGAFEHALNACGGAPSALLPVHSRIAMAVLGGSNIPTTRRHDYERLASDVIGLACATGATLSIRAITSNSFSQDIAFLGTIPPSTDNPMIAAELRKHFVSEAVESVDALYAVRHTGASDVTAAIRVAAEDLISGNNPRYLFIIGHGWSETPINLFRSGEDPRRRMPQLIRRVESSGGLDLQGINVYFVGVAAGPRMNASDEQLFELCEAWKSFVSDSHGRLAYCGAEFPEALRSVSTLK